MKRRSRNQAPEVGQRCGGTSQCGWLEADVIIDGISEPLFAAQVGQRYGRPAEACAPNRAKRRSALLPAEQ